VPVPELVVIGFHVLWCEFYRVHVGVWFLVVGGDREAFYGSRDRLLPWKEAVAGLPSPRSIDVMCARSDQRKILTSLTDLSVRDAPRGSR